MRLALDNSLTTAALRQGGGVVDPAVAALKSWLDANPA